MSKTLTASVKLNTTDAENKLKRLAVSINYINKAINGKSTNALEKSLDKQLIAAQKVRKVTADAELAEMRVAAAKEKQAQSAKAKADAEARAIERQRVLENNLLLQQQQAEQRKAAAEAKLVEQKLAAEEKLAQKKQQAAWKAFQAEQAAHEREVSRQIKQELAETKRKEAALKKLADQESKLRAKQEKEEKLRIQRELEARKRANQEVSNDILRRLRGVVGAYLGVMSLRVVIDTADTITSAENKLNNINGGDTNATQSQMDAMYAAAQRSRMGYGDMMANVSKSMTLAPNAFGGNMDNAIKFQEIMAKSYALGGASAAEQSSSMYQLIQALGSGRLQGDELRSLTEGAPLAAKEIEKYVQGVLAAKEAEQGLEAGALGSKKALKDLGSEGILTSDMLVNAMLNAGDGIEAAFANTKMTFAQFGVMAKNTLTKSFEPALQKINEALNTLADNGAFNALSAVLTIIGKVAYWVASGFAWIAENWNTLKIIILPLITLLGLLGFAMLAFAAYTTLSTLAAKLFGNAALMAWLKALWPVALVIAAIVAVIAYLNSLGISFGEILGFIVSGIMGAASVIWNTLVTLLTVILKSILLPLFQQWDNFANFFGNLFNDPITAIVRAFEGLADTVLSILQTIADGIDAIFGTNLGETVQGWRDWVGTKADDLANKWGNGTYEEKSAVSDEIDKLLSDVSTSLLWDTSDAHAMGYDWGMSAGNWVSDKLSGLAKWDDMLKVDEEISNNTGNMADSMQLTAEDLKYLRDVANMEWKKEFTTANITVDMTNNNNVSNDYDLNSLAIGLRGMIEEEMYAVANGTYV